MELATKEKKRTLAEVEKELQAIQKHLVVECGKCDGSGKPIHVKTGKPPQGGHGNTKCGTCHGTGELGNRFDLIETDIVEIKRTLNKIKSDLHNHINKQSVEIRVLPEGHDPSKHGGNDLDEGQNGWEDYSGKFDLENDEEMSIVIGKAVAHFEEYFKDGFYHRNKRLGLFLSNATTSGKLLIEEFQTEE